MSGVRARCTDTTSAAFATSTGDAARVMPISSAAASVSERLQATTFMPKARARAIVSRPMAPVPTIPRVRPSRPLALPYFVLFHWPARRSATPSGICRSRARMRPMASSATAIEFLPGQLET